VAYFKVIGTITWEFESDESIEECTQLARKHFATIVNESHAQKFEDFSMQIEIAKMRDKKKLIHLASFELDEVLPFATIEESKKEYFVNNQSYQVRMNSDRYFVFLNSKSCVSCGLEGSKMILDKNSTDTSPHFNMYAEENGRLILMTKDHILAKSKGGKDEITNYATCCIICNNLKANYDLTYDQVNELRKIHSNPNKLPHKELRRVLNQTRSKMIGKHHK